MAQTGFCLHDEGRVFTALNDSGTTAIVAGDIVFTGTVNDVLTGTAASARNAYAGGDIKVFGPTCSATGYKSVLGIALEDIPAAGYGAIATEGIFIHPVSADTEAGDVLSGVASLNKVVVLAAGTTTTKPLVQHKIGRALTGGSTDGKYIIWKLAL